MTEKFQNAVVVGKVVLPAPKKEVVVQKKERPAPPPKREERPKQMKRFGDQRPQQAANQAMLQELQYIKKQLASAKEQLAVTSSNLKTLRDAATFALANAYETNPKLGEVAEVAALEGLLERLKGT